MVLFLKNLTESLRVLEGWLFSPCTADVTATLADSYNFITSTMDAFLFVQLKKSPHLLVKGHVNPQTLFFGGT